MKNLIIRWSQVDLKSTSVANVFMSKKQKNGYVILCLYVDDTLIVGSNDDMIKSTKNMLKSKFDMKDMGFADVILGIKISRASNELILSQTHYVDKIFGKLNKDNNTVSKTPLDTVYIYRKTEKMIFLK